MSVLHVTVRSPYCAAPCKPTGTPPGDHVLEGVPVIDLRQSSQLSWSNTLY